MRRAISVNEASSLPTSAWSAASCQVLTSGNDMPQKKVVKSSARVARRTVTGSLIDWPFEYPVPSTQCAGRRLRPLRTESCVRAWFAELPSYRGGVGSEIAGSLLHWPLTGHYQIEIDPPGRERKRWPRQNWERSSSTSGAWPPTDLRTSAPTASWSAPF